MSEVHSAIKNLKRNKAPGHDMIQNEHIIYGGQELVISMTESFNCILRTEIVPDSWKHSIIVPLYKGKGKDKTDPNSYRPVSLTPSFSKIYEKIILDRILQFLHDEKIIFPCPQQQGFQKNLSCITTAFNLQETICTNLDLHSNVYAAFLDTEKAFDTVWHSALFYKLHNLGIKGKLWKIIKNMYDGLTFQVSINNFVSMKGSITKGVRQGGVMSGFLYLVHIDDLLYELANSNCGAEVCSVKCGNPALCDDLTVMATLPRLLQIMLDISFKYSLKWNFGFQSVKSCVVLFSKQNVKSNTVFMLGDQPLKNEDHATHLGIRYDANLKSKTCTKECCQKGLNTFYAMLGYGVHPSGLNPMTCVSLYKKIVIPSILYGSEVWNNISKAETDQINRTQRRIVKKI